MPNNSISLWTSLAADKSKLGFRRIDSVHLLDFYLGLDSESRYTLLLVCDYQPNFQSELKSVKVICSSRDDGRWSLFLILEDVGLLELFSLLCNDLIETSRAASDPVEALDYVLHRLSNWRLLFERGGMGLLLENEVRGLCGELLYLRELIAKLGLQSAVASWVGPFLADQDFQAEDFAWEVKTSRPGGSIVTISSEGQLDTTVREIFLVVVELANCSALSADAWTLNLLVQELRGCMKGFYDSRNVFDKTLFKAGYLERSEYNNYYFAVRKISTYGVFPSFPRITIGSLPDGVSGVSYKLDLKNCELFRIS